jgi:YD repeat-containing protein
MRRAGSVRLNHSRESVWSAKVLSNWIDTLLGTIGLIVPSCYLQIMRFKTILLITLVTLMNVSAARADSYDDALEIVRSSPAGQRLLGSDIKVQTDQPASRPDDPDSDFEEWSVQLSGALGSGHLYGVANQINASSEFSRLVLVADGGESVDLTPPPPRLQLPTVPVQKVYILPIGFSKRESLDWAPAYYKAKLGINVVVLPPIPLDPKLIDPVRKQLNADDCLDYLPKSQPQISRDPSAILIGVTSHDMYIPEYVEQFGWRYSENLRAGDRFALISSARLRPSSIPDKQNPEWQSSRLQKLLTKNLLVLYFNLPLSSDDTSALRGGLQSGKEIDRMSGQIIGTEGRWNPFINVGGPGVTIYDVPGKSAFWKMVCPCGAYPDARTAIFTSDLGIGLFMMHKTDFFFDDSEPFELTRSYNSRDDIARSFGIGTMESLDMFLVGQMGVEIDLYQGDSSSVHFERVQAGSGWQAPQVYRETKGEGGPFAHATAEFSVGIWKITRTDGWTYFFPYHAQWLPQYVTVIGSFTDPQGRKYKTERDNFGALVSFKTPSGKWLHFENDSAHRIRKITSSLGRTVQYGYDAGGHLTSVTDSEGHNDAYSYDDKGQMITVSHGKGAPILKNTYFMDGYIKEQTLADGRKFQYWYHHGPRNVIEQNMITDPNGLVTYVQYGSGGYVQSLPTRPPN